MKTILAVLIAVTLSGCRMVQFDVYYHPDTNPIKSDATSSSFEQYPNFVDQGVLFVPSVRELPWEPLHRSFVIAYAKEPLSVYVSTVSARAPDGTVTTLTIDEAFILERQPNGLCRTYISALFRDAPNATPVFSAKQVTLEIQFWIGSERGSDEPRTMKFEIKRKRVKDVAWPT